MDNFLPDLVKSLQQTLSQNKPTTAINCLQKIAAFTCNELALLSIAHLKQYEDAVPLMEMACRLKPDNCHYQSNLAYVYNEVDRWEEAKEHALRATQLDSNKAKAWYQLGIVQQNLGDFEGAIKSYEQILSSDAQFGPSRFNMGICHLQLCHWEEGWKGYHYRFEVFDKPKTCVKRFRKIYTKGEDLRDKTVYVFNEQGAGDFINFLRYVPLLKSVLGAARVILECQTRYADLACEVDQVVTYERDEWPEDIPDIDFAVSICSLPEIFGQIPFVPYITPAPVGLACGSGFKVGICWAGSPGHANDYRRSCPVDKFLPLADLGVNLFSLQTGSVIRTWRGQQVSVGKCKSPIVNLETNLHTFADTAAAIAEMDLVISVDTAVAHLAGAMGKPVWLLVDVCNDWRWMASGQTTAWYPSMKIFRQSGMNWEPVFKDVASELACVCGREPECRTDTPEESAVVAD